MQDHIRANYSKWGHFYKVEFDITVSANLPSKWNNVFHFIIKDNNKNYGDRVPAFMIHQDKYFYITSAVNGNRNNNIKIDFEFGKTSILSFVNFKIMMKK